MKRFLHKCFFYGKITTMAPAAKPNGLTSLLFLALLGWFLFWLWSPAGWIYVGILIASVARAVEERRAKLRGLEKTLKGMEQRLDALNENTKPVLIKMDGPPVRFPSRGGAA